MTFQFKEANQNTRCAVFCKRNNVRFRETVLVSSTTGIIGPLPIRDFMPAKQTWHVCRSTLRDLLVFYCVYYVFRIFSSKVAAPPNKEIKNATFFLEGIGQQLYKRAKRCTICFVRLTLSTTIYRLCNMHTCVPLITRAYSFEVSFPAALSSYRSDLRYFRVEFSCSMSFIKPARC